MPTTINQIYQQICTVLLEDGGLSLGLMQPSQVVNFITETTVDFLTKTGIVKKIVCIPIFAGIDTYTLPDRISDTQYGMYAQSYLHRTSAFYLDNSNSTWESTTGFPITWKQDEIQPKQIQLSPIPNTDGDFVLTSGLGFFGVISAVSSTNDLNIIGPSTGLYGVISGFSGSPYIESLGPFYGTISGADVDTNNLMTLSTAIPANTYTALNTNSYLELIPDSFTPYIKYGSLWKVFSQDGECKDIMKANYCQSRYNEGINLAAAIMTEEFDQEQS